MIKFWSPLLFLIIISCPIFPQQKDSRLESITKKFQSFDYQTVIIKADSLLNTENDLNDSEKVEINRLKGISHYSLLQMRLALNSFINILKVKPNYEMNPTQNSPKIVKYFNEIKENFKDIMLSKINEKENAEKLNTLLINQRAVNNTAIGYSLLLPGLGHLHHGETTKGWSLISAAIVTLGSSIYFIVDSNSKENDYLNEVEKSQIEIKYKRYNDAYTYRNISLISFAAVWLYTQTDLLFLRENKIGQVEVYPSILFSAEPQLNINIYF